MPTKINDVTVSKNDKYNGLCTQSFLSTVVFIFGTHSGHISMQEFEDALNILTRQLELHIKTEDIRDIAESIDINKDGCIDFNEFLEAFR